MTQQRKSFHCVPIGHLNSNPRGHQSRLLARRHGFGCTGVLWISATLRSVIHEKKWSSLRTAVCWGFLLQLNLLAFPVSWRGDRIALQRRIHYNSTTGLQPSLLPELPKYRISLQLCGTPCSASHPLRCHTSLSKPPFEPRANNWHGCTWLACDLPNSALLKMMPLSALVACFPLANIFASTPQR